jgi:low affinity Fe/Cu permease
LDDAILATAKREVHAGPKPLSPFSTKWTLPFSLAAVIVLSVSVVTLVQKESPREVSSGIASVDQAAEQTSTLDESVRTEKQREEMGIAAKQLKENSLAIPTMRAQPPQTETERKVPSAPKPAAAPVEQAEPPQRMSASRTPPLSSSSNVQAEADADGEFAGKNESKPSVVISLADVQKRQTITESKTKSQIGERAPAEESTVAEADISTDIPGDESEKMTPSPEKSLHEPMGQSLAFTAESQPQEKPESVSEPAQSTSSITALSAQSAKPSPTQHCPSLTIKECLQSLVCTLVLSDDSKHDNVRYQCRKSANRCEQNFNQLQASKDNCESKPGCRFVPGNCECPAGKPCDCQRKDPPQCTN